MQITNRQSEKYLANGSRPYIRKRFIIETVIGVLKEQIGMVHTRHRSVENAFVHIISCLVAYCLRKNKSKIRNAKSKYQIT